MLFIGSCAGKFLSLDKATGKEVWSYDTKIDGGPFSFHGDPFVRDGLVLIAADRGCDVPGYVYAFNKETGKLQWKVRARAPATSFVDAGDAVVVGTREDEWFALSIDSGKRKWDFQAAVPDPDCEIPKPATTDGKIFALVSHDQVVHILDLKSGKELRQRKLSSPSTTALFMYKDVLYFGTKDGRLRSLDPATGQWFDEQDLRAVPRGRFAWSKNTAANTEYVFGSGAVDKQKNGIVLAFTDEFESVLWSRSSEAEWTSEQPHVWKQWLIAGNCHGDMAAYRTTDGVLAWTEHLQGCIRSFGHDSSTLYVGMQQGTVLAYTR